MANETIRMDFPKMHEMSQAFRDASNTMDEVMAEINKIAALVEEGALKGRAGDVFLETLQGLLTDNLRKLQNKFNELDSDVQHAVSQMEGADTTSGGYFS